MIWNVVLDYSRDNLMFGAGYGSLWNVGVVSPLYKYSSIHGFISKIGLGHQGYFDLLGAVGLPGLVLIVSGVFFVPAYKIFVSPSISRSRGSLSFALLIFCMGHNFTESSLLERDQIVNVFLLLAVAMVHYDAKPPRLFKRRTGKSAGVLRAIEWHDPARAAQPET
jgi:O-antigen ligase